MVTRRRASKVSQCRLVPQEQLNDNLLGTKLSGQAAKAGFVAARWNSDHQLVAELLGQLPFQTKWPFGCRFPTALDDAHASRRSSWGSRCMRPEAATLIGGTGPSFNVLVDLLPATEIEVADAEIGSLRNHQRFR